jgi:FkbM family methyltransferase
MSEIALRMNDGFTIVVPASLDAITTYVILEQEKWFEKEATFLARWLRRGMNVIDVGANLGVYSLPIARLVGPDGAVFSYEPASETRRLLKLSKKKNRANNLHVIANALSDGEREGHLALGTSSELNTLGGSGPGENVQITSLDAEDRTRNWGNIDFLKIDAEGEEERILNGASAFFARQSPLVMFEVKAGDKPNESLRSAFIASGFSIYRLLGHAPVLVPVAVDESIDGFELNFFAAKPDRAAMLATEGLLVDAISEWQPDDQARAKAVAAIREQRFAPAFAQLLDDGAPVDPAYRDALAGYATWRSPDLPLPDRYAALRFACDTLWTLCEKDSSLARLSTLARVAAELGRRGQSVHALNILSKILKDGSGRMVEPFWPANPRFDLISPDANIIQWFVVSTLEQFEQTASYSSMFRNSGVDLDWLSSQPFVSAEIDRRRILLRARAGQKIQVPPRLLTGAADHLNADIWRGGLVPNTIVRR